MNKLLVIFTLIMTAINVFIFITNRKYGLWSHGHYDAWIQIRRLWSARQKSIRDGLPECKADAWFADCIESVISKRDLEDVMAARLASEKIVDKDVP